MPVSIKGTDLVYFPAPKIACSSVKTAILHHNDPERAAELGTHLIDGRPEHVHDVYPSYRFRPWYPVKFGGRSRWVCLVRDPIKRFVSGYRNRILFHRDLETKLPERMERSGLNTSPDLNEFALNLESYIGASLAVRHHFLPITRYLGRRPQRYFRIFDLSQIDALSTLFAEAGAPMAFPHEQTGGPKVSVDDLTDASRQKLEAYYEIDYRLWGRYMA